MSICKEDAIDYLIEQIGKEYELIIREYVDKLIKGKEDKMFTYKEVASVHRELLKTIPGNSKDLMEYKILGRDDSQGNEEVRELEDSGDLVTYQLDIDDIESPTVKDRYQKIIFIPLLISLMTFFPALILAGIMNVSMKFITITVLIVNVVYIIYNAIRIALEENEKYKYD